MKFTVHGEYLASSKPLIVSSAVQDTMADASLLLHLLVVILCLDSVLGQTTDYPYYVPTSLLPVACILLALVILVLCLISFVLICLSTLVNTDDDGDDHGGETVVSGVSGNHKTGKTLTQKHDSYERDDPPTRQEDKGLALKVKWEPDELSDDVIINMDPYHCGSELKNTTRSLLQGVGRAGEAPQRIPASSGVLSTRSRSLEDVTLGSSRDLDREASGIASTGIERDGGLPWTIKVHKNHEQGFRHMDHDPEIIIRG